MMRRLPILFLLVVAVAASACGTNEPDGSTAANDTPTPPTSVAETAVAETAVAETAVAEPTLPSPDATPDPATSDPTPSDPATSDPAAPEPAAPEPAASADPSPATEPDSTPTPPSYDAPGDLEVPFLLEVGLDPGTLIDTEELDIPGAIGQRILYYSTRANGDNLRPSAVSGFVAYPKGEPPVGGWPLIAWAHGTTGLGDSCAPSHNAETDAVAQALVGFGYAVVATDYEGLGTPGTHPYVVGASEAHSVLDSVRAVHNLGLPVTDEWIAFGHSQGGHAAMFTANYNRPTPPNCT